MTVHSWGENPVGRWTLEIHNDAHAHWESEANFYKWSLELYGAAFDPNSEEFKKSSLKVLRNVDQQVSTVNFGNAIVWVGMQSCKVNLQVPIYCYFSQ